MKNTTDTKPIDKIAKIFLGSDSRREWMMQLNEQGGFVYGTDAHCLIKADKSLFQKEYPPHTRTANFKALYSNYTYNEKIINISCNELKSLLSKIEKVYDVLECPECNGDGTVRCNYGHDHECDQCEGEGFQENRMTDKVFPKDDHYIQIIDSYIKPFYIDKLVCVADFTGIETIEMVSYGSNKAHIFKIGEIEIVLMPIFPENTEDWEDKKTYKLV